MQDFPALQQRQGGAGLFYFHVIARNGGRGYLVSAAGLFWTAVMY